MISSAKYYTIFYCNTEYSSAFHSLLVYLLIRYLYFLHKLEDFRICSWNVCYVHGTVLGALEKQTSKMVGQLQSRGIARLRPLSVG